MWRSKLPAEKSPKNTMMTMTNKSLLSLMIAATMLTATTAWAQEGATERDPFHTTEKRVAGPPPVPAGNAWGRDPFNNPLANRTPVRTQRGPDVQGKGLTGIIYSKHVRLAIFNGEALREGGSIGDRKVVSIGVRSVRLKNAAGSIEEVFLQDFSMRK
jgi:hypothetical protein